LYYLLSDHLGSTSLTTNNSGGLISELRYKPWGETRYTSGTTATNYRYTGQREESTFGLYFYNARWYDPYLNHFTQPDTIVPDPTNPQSYDRYAYALNNPIRYNDPSGHKECESEDDNGQCLNQLNFTKKEIQGIYDVNLKGRWKIDQLLNLYQVLDKYAAAVGGADRFNFLVSGVNVILDTGTIPLCGAAYACWNNRDTIYLHQEIFGFAYLQNYLQAPSARRPAELGLDNPDMSSQVTIAHEFTHLMADDFYTSSIIYGLNVDDAEAFGGSSEESMATAVGIYVVTGGQPYPAYQDQMDVAKGLISGWGALPGAWTFGE